MALIGLERPSIATDAGSRLITNRRGFLAGVGILLAAPAIARASSLMNIRGEPLLPPLDYIPCDGRILRKKDEPDLFWLLEGDLEACRTPDENGFYRCPSSRSPHNFHEEDQSESAAFSGRGWGGRLIKPPARRYGGSLEDDTFALPDFRQFEMMDAFDGGQIELDRKGDLFVLDRRSGERKKI